MRVSQPTTNFLNPGAYWSIVSNTAKYREREEGGRGVGRRRKKEARNERREDRREEERKEKERKKGKEKWEGGREEGGRKEVSSIHTLLYTIWLTSITLLSVLTDVSIVFLPLLCPLPLGQMVRGVLCEYGEHMTARGSNGWIEGGWDTHLNEGPIGIEGWCIIYT